jgi:hypothetical protein
MRTREEAVEYLRARGFYAEKRDWVLGETVVAATGRSEASGIAVYARAMYIVPKESGWISFELDRARPDDELPVSLDEACARVVTVLTAPHAP